MGPLDPIEPPDGARPPPTDPAAAPASPDPGGPAPSWRDRAQALKGLADKGWGRLRRAVDKANEAPPVKRAAIYGAWASLAFSLFCVVFFFYVTLGIPSTRNIWSATDNPSITFVDRNGRVIIREGAQNAPPVNLDKIPAYVPNAIIAIEDRRFYKHMGVDFGGLMRAGVENLEAGRVVQGGSTITQQLAKNLFLSPSRSYLRKAEEAAITVMLEAMLPKRRILELYLNVIEWGSGVFGAEEASRHYFGTTAAQLSAEQAARLAAMAPNPRFYERNPRAPGLNRKIDVILARMPGAEIP